LQVGEPQGSAIGPVPKGGARARRANAARRRPGLLVAGACGRSADNPVRMLLSAWREPPRRDDDLLRDAARQLLDLLS
jgi:hypothetical protein